LFLERYLDWLAPNGILVAIVPDSILTNQGVYRALREGMADHVRLLSVTSLPPVTFAAAGTSTKTSILHLQKTESKPTQNSSTYFAVCNDIGFEVSSRGSSRNRVATQRNDLPTVLAEAMEEDKPTLGTRIPFDNGEPRWDANYHASLPSEVANRLVNPRRTDTAVKDVAALVNDRVNPKRYGRGEFQYIEISGLDSTTACAVAKRLPCQEAPSRARKRVQSGDVLVSTVRPERRAIAVVPDSLDGAICSTGIAVLRPRRIASLLLARLLQSDFVNAQLLRNNIGIAYPAFDEQCLPEVVLPVAEDDAHSLAETSDNILEHRRALAEQEEEFQDRVATAIARWSSR